jgi:cephalosporin-C deacetylase-like acetyl esterase
MKLASALLVASALQGADLAGEFSDYLRAQAESHWRARTAAIERLDSPAKLRERQEFIRKWLIDAMGGFPTKIALNARVTGGFERNGYRVENLVFESQPKFYVTANVYVPTSSKPPFPAVVGTAGHSETGKAIGNYQQAWIALAKRGFLVLAFDPPGQGERLEYFDPKSGKSSVGVGTREHDATGAQCILTGAAFARYEVWDGIRSVDYLLTRSDVDPKRIGVAGNSGGGTQAAYLAAVEPRLAAAVSSCYMTKWEQMWASPGPQDSEQNFPGFLSAGLDFGDFFIAAAPRAVTMLTGTRDYFPIAGGHATHQELKRVFGVIDASARTGFYEHDSEHGWNQPRREATTRWLMQWLQGNDDDGKEGDIQPESEKLLNVTRTGQVSTSLGGVTSRNINAALAQEMFPQRTAAGIREPERLRALIAMVLNVTSRSGLPVVSREDGRLLLETEPGLHIAAQISGLTPSGRRPAVLFVNPAGKSAETDAIRNLVAAGNVVMAIDPRGWGESAPPPNSRGYSNDWQMAQRAMLIGKPLPGMQTFDILRAFDYLATLPEVDPKRIRIIGIGAGGLVAMFAAALEPRIVSVETAGALESYMSVVRADVHKTPAASLVPGVLKHFDVDDLKRAIAPRSVSRR